MARRSVPGACVGVLGIAAYYDAPRVPASTYIENPRRGPRAPARCKARVLSPSGALEAETEDLGSHGCQLVAPRPLRKGDPVKLVIANDRVPDALRVAGRVAWASARAPWRLGVAFDDDTLDESTRWFERFVAAHPGVPVPRRIPTRIPVDAMLYLGPAPRFVVDFDRHEAAILRAIGSGTSVGELMARLRDDREPRKRALFSLLARQHLTLSRGASVHPHAWKAILTDLEASLAVEALEVPSPPSAPGAAPPGFAAAPPAPLAQPPMPARPAPTPPPQESRSAAREIDGGGAWGSWGAPLRTPVPDFTGAGVGWRGAAGPRSPEAQACLDLASIELAAGRVSGALSLLRRALALTPGDAEIAGAIGRLAFKDRQPGGR
jgi:hypothetical protein